MGMNCFQWRNRSSDFLDGALLPVERNEAETHLETCQDCRTRHDHYRQLLGMIAKEPRVDLPLPIRRSPLSFVLPRLGAGVGASRWERTPWLVRSALETLGVGALVFLVVAMVPRLRTLYERNLEKNLDAYDLARITPGLETASPPGIPQLARGKSAEPPGAGHADEFASEGDEESAAEDDSVIQTEDPEVRVGSSEIWRFNLRTDSPRETRPRIVSILSGLHISQDTPGLGGTEAPGGIQFDLIVPNSAIAPLKKQLQHLAASSAPARTEPAPSGGATGRPLALAEFTWFKNKSKRPIPPGKARIVIWLSQT